MQVLKIIVGRDFPKSKIRDTAQYKPVMQYTRGGMKPRKLKHVA